MSLAGYLALYALGAWLTLLWGLWDDRGDVIDVRRTIVYGALLTGLWPLTVIVLLVSRFLALFS